tara:strand:- start:228 stop:410 length:183 start_codon:yes stop_codon:yes gene_type:complete
MDEQEELSDIISKILPLEVQVSALDTSERIIAILPIHIQAKLIKTLLEQNILLRRALVKE